MGYTLTDIYVDYKKKYNINLDKTLHTNIIQEFN